MKVQTAVGPTEIRDIQPGDVVYSWNDDGKLAASRVVRRSRPRYQQTYRLRTIHREITASGNHPFLTLRQAPAEHPEACSRCGKGPVRGRGLCATCYARHRRHGTLPPRPEHGENYRAWTTEWVNLEDLHRGDTIVTLRSLPDDAPVPDDPHLSDKRFLWLLGLAFGDGSLSGQRANRVYLCVFGDLREDVQNRLRDYCGKNGIENPKHGLYLHNAGLASGLRRFGIGAKSTERLLPRELWALPHDHIQAFLDGYTAADGHHLKRASDPALSYKAANRGLVEDVQNLHMILGHNVTRVRELKRTRPIVIKGKEVKNARSLWTFEAYETGRKTTGAGARFRIHGDLAAMFPADSHFAPQQVTAIEPLDSEDTYDITVEDTRNFVAEGLVVRNWGLRPGRTLYPASQQHHGG